LANAVKKPDNIELPPSLANYYEDALIGHVSSWMEEGRSLERAVSILSSFLVIQTFEGSCYSDINLPENAENDDGYRVMENASAYCLYRAIHEQVDFLATRIIGLVAASPKIVSEALKFSIY
jgi:hypothetical protein